MLKVIPGSNDLATLRPDIAAQWHPTKNGDLTPEMITAGRNKKAWWVCSVNSAHIWEAVVYNRTKGSGCPFCSGRRAIPAKTDLATINPELAAQWHPTKNGDLTPQDVTVSSGKKAWWVCSVNSAHIWEAVIASRTIGRGCPFCSNKQVLAGDNDLATINPELAAQWHPTKNGDLASEMVTISSNKKVWWVCPVNSAHIWESTVDNRTRGTGCPFCSGQRVLAGDNDLATINPELAAQWHSAKNGTLTPQDVTISSGKKTWWVCLVNPKHEWETYIYSRKTADIGCPICWSTTIVSRAENEIYNTLTELGLTVQRNARCLIGGRKELDLYIQEKKFAIEFNGCYWHSEATGKNRNHHYNKWQACKNKGITLYQVWSDDWASRKNIVIRGLAHRLGITSQLKKVLPDLPDYYSEKIGARKTNIATLDYSTASVFLKENHIQGPSTGTYYLGLQDALGRLRSVLVLSRTGKSGELRIDRYASAGTVSGGFTKLLSYAEREYKPERFITFADQSISDGGLYERTGFIVDGTISPDYSYLVNGRRVHKFNYRLARFRTDPNLLWEEGLTESELALLNNITRIWDSGKTRYVKDVLQTTCDRM